MVLDAEPSASTIPAAGKASFSRPGRPRPALRRHLRCRHRGLPRAAARGPDPARRERNRRPTRRALSRAPPRIAVRARPERESTRSPGRPGPPTRIGKIIASSAGASVRLRSSPRPRPAATIAATMSPASASAAEPDYRSRGRHQPADDLEPSSILIVVDPDRKRKPSIAHGALDVSNRLLEWKLRRVAVRGSAARRRLCSRPSGLVGGVAPEAQGDGVMRMLSFDSARFRGIFGHCDLRGLLVDRSDPLATRDGSRQARVVRTSSARARV